MKRCIFAVLAAVAAVAPLSIYGQGSSAEVPRVIRYNGTLKNADGSPRTGIVGISIAIYADESSSVPLWQEIQNVTVDETGHYAALIGASKSEGLPVELFSANTARWLAIRVENEPEQPRAILAAVPYALKAGDAETLGGKPLSAFLLNDSPAAAGVRSGATGVLTVAVPTAIAGSSSTITTTTNTTVAPYILNAPSPTQLASIDINGDISGAGVKATSLALPFTTAAKFGGISMGGSPFVTGDASKNILLGTGSAMNNGLTNATAIGANATVSQSNTLVLGSIAGVNGAAASTKVGIGTASPAYALDVQGGAINSSGGLSTASNVTAGGDISTTANVVATGSVTANAVNTQNLNGTPIASTAPSSGQTLTYTGGKWQPGSGQVAVSLGSGLSGSTSVPLGGTLSLANTGVLGVTASGVLTSSGGQNPDVSLTGIVPVGNGGTGTNSSTGSGSVVLSASPTLTGTLAVPNVNATTGYQVNGASVYTLSKITYITATGSSTYTVPSGVKALLVECVGGGGGGGTASWVAQQNFDHMLDAGGGGAGGYARKFIASPSASYSVTVGAGGGGQSIDANNFYLPGSQFGFTGGDTTWDSSGSPMTCSGGAGGESDSYYNTAPLHFGGAGGSASGGDVNISGQTGGDMARPSGNNVRYRAAGGASSPFGAGAVGTVIDTLNGWTCIGPDTVAAGVAASGYGAGGSGGHAYPKCGNTTYLQGVGGAGSQGVLVIWEYK